MFDIAPSEFLLVAFVALVVIGPKDLPKAMRVVGYWVGKARGVARQFRSGFDSMVREAELEEMEKRWASENERIMREHPPTDTAHVVHSPEPDTDAAAQSGANHETSSSEPVMVEKPVVLPAPTMADAAAPAHDARPDTRAGLDLFDRPEAHAQPVDGSAHAATDAKAEADARTGKSDIASS